MLVGSELQLDLILAKRKKKKTEKILRRTNNLREKILEQLSLPSPKNIHEASRYLSQYFNLTANPYFVRNTTFHIYRTIKDSATTETNYWELWAQYLKRYKPNRYELKEASKTENIKSFMKEINGRKQQFSRKSSTQRYFAEVKKYLSQRNT